MKHLPVLFRRPAFTLSVIAVGVLAIAIFAYSTASGYDSTFVERIAIDAQPAGNSPTSVSTVDGCVAAADGDELTIDVVVTGLSSEAVTDGAIIELVFDPAAITVTNVDMGSSAFGPTPIWFADYDYRGAYGLQGPPGTTGDVMVQSANFFGSTTGTTSLVLFSFDVVYHGSDAPTSIEIFDDPLADPETSPALIAPGPAFFRIGTIQGAQIAPAADGCPPATPTPAPPTPLPELPADQYFKLNESGHGIWANDLSPEGILVGQYSDPRYHYAQPFSWERGVMKILPIPHDWTGEAEGVNGDGEVVGWADGPSGMVQGVIWREGVAEFPDLPCESSLLFDVNNLGELVGICDSYQPFKITSTGFEYLEVGSFFPDDVPLNVRTMKINDLGTIMIQANDRTIVVDGDNVTELGSTWLGRTLDSDLNEQGDVIFNAKDDPTNVPFDPHLWKDGAFISLDPPFQPHSGVNALDDAGRTASNLLLLDDGTVIDLADFLPEPIRDDRNYPISPWRIARFTDTGYFLLLAATTGSRLKSDLLLICLPDYASPPSSEGCPVRTEPTPTPSPTPVPTPTPQAIPALGPGIIPTIPPTVGGATVTPAPTPTPTPEPVIWGDMNCDSLTDGHDVLMTLLFLGGVAPAPSDCPAPGDTTNGAVWGDYNCDKTLDPADLLAALRAMGGLSYDHAGDCPAIGSAVAAN